MIFKTRKEEPPLPTSSTVGADSAYQGLQKMHRKAEISKWEKRGRPLTDMEKVFNQELG